MKDYAVTQRRDLSGDVAETRRSRLLLLNDGDGQRAGDGRLAMDISSSSGMPCDAVSCDAMQSDSWDAGAHGWRPALAVGRAVGPGMAWTVLWRPFWREGRRPFEIRPRVVFADRLEVAGRDRWPEADGIGDVAQ